MRLCNGTSVEYYDETTITISRIINSKVIVLTNRVTTVKGVFVMVKAYEHMNDMEFLSQAEACKRE